MKKVFDEIEVSDLDFSELGLEGYFFHGNESLSFDEIPFVILSGVKVANVKVYVITISIDFSDDKKHSLLVTRFSVSGVTNEYFRRYIILNNELIWATDCQIKTRDRGDGWLDGYLEANDPDCKADFFAGMESLIKERYLLPLISKDEPLPSSKLSRLTKIFSSKK